MIELKHLKKEYDLATPLMDVNAVINDGDIISVIGPSGTGKSTLLRSINMLERPTSGQVIVDGEDITAAGYDLSLVRQKIGMVFQSFNLFNGMTVIENIMTPQIDLLGRGRQEAYDNGMKLLRAVGLSEMALKYPDEMSGGQKQRVAIARTLAMDPEMILLDEPTSALDPTMVGEVEAVIRELAKMGKTMMIVTHDMAFAREICNRVFYMDDGGIYEDGTPEQIFDAPTGEKTRRFIRHLKVYEQSIKNKNYDFLGTQTSILQYCEKNQIPRRMTSHLNHAFEETVQQMLIPRFDKPDIDITIEYSDTDESCLFSVRYGGDEIDPSKDGDELSLSLLSGIAKDMQHEYKDGINEFSMKILP